MYFLLFFFGAAAGSFLNVVSLRYKPNRFLLAAALGGRSRCPKCKKTLRWFELVPMLSFVIQGGRCRRCAAKLSLQYPAVEVLSGLIFVFVPAHLGASATLAQGSIFYLLSSIFWICIFLALLVVSLVDLRLSLIPDEASVFLLIMGFLLLLVGQASAWRQSFYSFEKNFFVLGQNLWLNAVSAAVLAGAFFWFLIIVSRGRGMGMGDLKLAVPLGLIFGWPETILLIGIAFVMGAIFGVSAIVLGKKSMKSAIPFGPFLAAAAAIVFFLGGTIVNLYFGAFSL